MELTRFTLGYYVHPGGRWARRSIAGMPCRHGPSTLCGSHICLHVSLPTTPVLPPGGCTSISQRSVFFCTGRRRRTGTGQTDGLLFPLLPTPQEVPLSGGNGRYAVPMLEPGARRQGPKASLLPWERPSLRPGLGALPEPAVPRQAQDPWQHPCRQPLGARRESTCRGLISSACSTPLMVRWTVESTEAKRYLVPQVA